MGDLVLKAACFTALMLMDDEPFSDMAVELEGTGKCVPPAPLLAACVYTNEWGHFTEFPSLCRAGDANPSLVR